MWTQQARFSLFLWKLKLPGWFHSLALYINIPRMLLWLEHNPHVQITEVIQLHVQTMVFLFFTRHCFTICDCFLSIWSDDQQKLVLLLWFVPIISLSPLSFRPVSFCPYHGSTCTLKLWLYAWHWLAVGVCGFCGFWVYSFGFRHATFQFNLTKNLLPPCLYKCRSTWE